MPESDLLDHPSLYTIIVELASTLEVAHLYYETQELQ